MAVRIITGEETIRVNYLWDMEDLSLECEEIKSPVFEVTDKQSRKSKWEFSLRLKGDYLVIDLDFSSACKSVILYSFYVSDGSEEEKNKLSVHRGWGSGDLIHRQSLLVRNSFLGRLRIFCEIICKLNVEIDESEIPGCQMIDELNFLFGFKNSKDKNSVMELNCGKNSLEHEEDKPSMKNQLIENLICNGEVEAFELSSEVLKSSLDECEDSICTQINIDNVLADLRALEVDRNIDRIIAATSFKELEMKNPKLAVTLLQVASNKISEFGRRLYKLKSFLHLQ